MPKSKQPWNEEPPEPTIEDVAGIVGVREALKDSTPIGTAPSGGDELSDEELAAQHARVIGPDLTPPDLMERLTAALEGLSKREADAGANSQVAAAMVMLAEALQGLRTGQMQAAQLQADMQRRVTRPENNFPPNISAFNLRGDKDFPRAQLKCKMFAPILVEQEASTREEIELLNLLQPGEFQVIRNDRSRIKMIVTIVKKLDSEEPSLLTVSHDTGFNNDNFRMLPHDFLRQLVMANPKTRAAGANVLTMDEERAMIEAGKFNDGRLAAEGERLVSVGE